MSDSNTEISKLLFSSFSPQFPKISKTDIVRLWSLELQWFNPNDANLVLSHLLDMNWIIESGDFLYPNSNVNLSPPILGWQPILRDILHSSVYDLKSAPIQDETDIITVKQKKQDSHDSDNELKSVEDKTNILINYVSKKSGLTNREVVRRSQRKRKALGPVTLWLCVSLLAREQGLDMEKINQILEK
ncbi:MAG: hypothetical protein CMB47_07395 [Euryarchaeota archaeon]|nr:hypothetical protein [Euryarchaeota archaeon]